MRSTLYLILFVLCTASVSVAGEPEPVIADSPETVRPLLVGATIPDVTLASLDGTPVELTNLVAKQPSILVFYRGGW